MVECTSDPKNGRKEAVRDGTLQKDAKKVQKRTACEALLDMETIQLRFGLYDYGAAILNVDLAEAFEKVCSFKLCALCSLKDVWRCRLLQLPFPASKWSVLLFSCDAKYDE